MTDPYCRFAQHDTLAAGDGSPKKPNKGGGPKNLHWPIRPDWVEVPAVCRIGQPGLRSV